MDDTEETKEEPTIAIPGVPVENIGQGATKTIANEQMKPVGQDDQFLVLPQGGHNYGSRR